ncbi:MAG: C4-dicarboxylate TRAP transporter substrate-binding protein [Silicimonas sp.]
MNVSTFVPENHPLARYSFTEWLPRLKEASGGTIEGKLFSSGSLLAAAANLSGLRDGVVQVAFVAGTYTPADLPEDNTLAQLSFNLSDAYAAAFALTEANFVIHELQAQWARFDVVYMGGYSTPTYNMICKEEVTTLDAIKGKRVRAPGAAYSDWIESVGAVPVNVPTSEMYSGLDKGILDCTVVPADEVVSRSLNEVASAVTMVDLGVYASGAKYAISKDFWSGLSNEQRQAFIDTIPQGIVDELQFYVGQVQSAVTSADELGITVFEPGADLAGSVEAHKKAVRGQAIEVGKSQFNLADPEKIVSEFEAIYAKWVGLLEGVDRSDDTALLDLLKTEIYSKIDPASYGL